MKHELNSQATKQILTDTLIHLAEKKPLSKITVSEITALCDINRKTFYYHFTDIYDLLEWYLNGEINKALRAFDSIYDFDSTISYAAEYMHQHPYLARFIEDPLGREKVTQVLNKVIAPLTSDIISKMEFSQNKNFDPDFREFLVKNFTRMIILSILDNIENPNNYDIEKMKQYLSSIFDISMRGLLQDI